jgi:predicted Zn-dependent protease
MDKAVRLEPDEPQWLIEQGELLRSLGHHARALPVLRAAVARKPGNFQARMALARTYEDLGELAAAARQLPAVPDASPAEIHLATGRIAVRAAAQTKDFDSLDQAANTWSRHARRGLPPPSPSIGLADSTS